MTGATGLLGRNLLFEFIKRNLGGLDGLELLVLGRGREGGSIHDRMRRIVLEDGLPYLGVRDEGAAERIGEYCATGIRCVDADLLKPRLGLSADDLGVLRRAPIDLFLHLAASSDFSTTASATDALYQLNVAGTRRVLDLVRCLDVREFGYVGTAYSCGTATGPIRADDTNLDQPFRNHYERTKLEGEIAVQAFERDTHTRCRYFRPSAVCGRLMEAPSGAACKFDTFYACAAFFYRAKLRLMGRERRDEPVQLNVRICANPDSALNIVPVDFVAKTIAEVCLQQAPGSHFHIVNERDTPYASGLLPRIAESLGMTGASCVDRVPRDLSATEAFYYRSVGQVLTPYMTARPMAFDTANLDPVLHRAGIRCPDVNDAGSFRLLMDYAKSREFGMRTDA